MTNPAPTDRIYINETFSLNEYSSSRIEVVIEQLTELLAEGYTAVDIEAQSNSYGGAELSFNVVRRRPESDEEYATRMSGIEAQRERRRLQYLRLRAEFEAS
jgi:hypothetical protein